MFSTRRFEATFSGDLIACSSDASLARACSFKVLHIRCKQMTIGIKVTANEDKEGARKVGANVRRAPTRVTNIMPRVTRLASSDACRSCAAVGGGQRT